MTPRIDIQTPAEVNETARALQTANRRRLEERQAQGWAERDALRLAKQARALVGSEASRAAKNDPWRGAVPEFEPVPDVRQKLLGKRFEVAGAYFQYGEDMRLRISTADRQKTVEIQLPSRPLWHEVFPAGGDRMIIVFHGWDSDVTYNEVPGSISYTNCQYDPCVEALFAAEESGFLSQATSDPDFSSLSIIDRQQCDEAQTPSYQVVSSYSVQPWYYSATINRTSIVVRSGWPQQFGSIIGQKYKVATGGGAIVNVGEQKSSFTGVTQIVTFQINYNSKPSVQVPFVWRVSSTATPAGYDQDLRVNTTANSFHVPTLLRFSTPGGPDIVGEWVFYPLMRCYGYGYLVNRGKDGQAAGWGNTPAVFSFIKNYKGEFHKEDGDRTMLINGMSYQYARDNYLQDDAPAYFLSADVAMPDAEVDTTRNYYYFRSPSLEDPLYFNDPLAFRNDGASEVSVTLRLNRQPYEKEVVRQTFSQSQQELEKVEGSAFLYNLEIPAAAWDWDRPLACWIELSRLGFTADDLMLTEDEQKALAEADWATVGFKF